MSEWNVCPWCESELHWDPAVGPEKECPYCNNELSGFRTLNANEFLDERADEDMFASGEHGERHASYSARSGGILAAQAVVEQLLDTQSDLPECSMCREYLVEVGEQIIDATQFKPRQSKLLKASLLTTPFTLIRYVCPSCYHTETKLSAADQERMNNILVEAAEHL